MEQKKIKELMVLMGRLGIKKLSLKKGDEELQLERETPEGFAFVENGRYYSEALTSQPRNAPPQLPHVHETPASSHAKNESHGSFINSPMVGTFYASPAPGAEPFVKVGQKVEKDTVVCIIEAMKVMNEIKAGHAGVIVEKLVDTESPVEFGTKLFKIS
jgi:acetyl-CoA carboxylase biotin carboxyl carrier protein